MCGIAGILGREGARATVERMTLAIAHRGPDGAGIEEVTTPGGTCTLGHRRLSIIDLGGGHQPMSNVEGDVWVTFNGEIYNFLSLRAELERDGVRFQRQSDTEVIAAGFARWGEALPAKLSGMFAFAVVDRRTGRFLVARDRSGIKPLYVASLADGALAFGSELSTLLAVEDVARKVSYEGLSSFLFADYAHPPHTLIRGVEKLAPGTMIGGVVGGARETSRYVPSVLDVIAPESLLSTDARHDRDAIGELERELDQAVESQLLADVPVGVFLSGGLDSSLVAALARRHVKGPLRSFSIGFAEKTFDESAHAREVARALGLEHVEETVDEAKLLEVVDPVLDSLDEPFADHSIFPTYVLSRLAARHVKVVLGGDGADELFGGYPTYFAHERHARLAAPLAPWVFPTFSRLVRRIPASDGYQALEWKLKRFVLRWDDTPHARHLRWMSALDVPDLERAMGPRYVAPSLLASRPIGAFGALAAMRLDYTSYMPGSVLTKVDRASMAHGLEARPPFLDERVIDFAFRQPLSRKLRGGQGKWIVRRVADALLPRSVIERKKHGFSIPLARWIRGVLAPRVETVLRDSPAFEVLSGDAYRSMYADHRARRGDHAKALFALLVLDRWMRRFGVS